MNACVPITQIMGENITFEDCNTLVALPDIREVYVAVDIKGCSVNGKNLS